MKIVVLNPSARFQSNGQEKYDYLAETVIEGLYKLEIDVITSFISNGSKRAYSDQEIISHSKTADHIFLIWGKRRGGRGEPRYDLLSKINRPESTIYIDGSEWTATGYPESKSQCRDALSDPGKRRGSPWINHEMLDYCSHYFKRECYQEDIDAGILPLPFGAVDRYFYNNDKRGEIDVFCSFGQISDGLRSETFNFCKSLKNEGYKVVTDSNLNYEEYKRLLSSSLVGIDAWGGGDCCSRIWEIFANKVCCLSQKYNIVIPHQFTDGENFYEYKNMNEFEDKIRFLLNNKEAAVEVGEQGYRHMMKYHTSESRARYIIEKIQ